MQVMDIWVYRNEAWSGVDLTGFDVEATDGKIGKVSDTTRDANGNFIVVETGPWIFGHKVMLPAGTISSVDTQDRTVFVNVTKDLIKNAPEFDESVGADETYRRNLGEYYSRGAFAETSGSTRR